MHSPLTSKTYVQLTPPSTNGHTLSHPASKSEDVPKDSQLNLVYIQSPQVTIYFVGDNNVLIKAKFNTKKSSILQATSTIGLNALNGMGFQKIKINL